MSVDEKLASMNSHLTIRDDLVEEGISVPVWFLDYKEDVKYGFPWKDRLAFAISADFDWN